MHPTPINITVIGSLNKDLLTITQRIPSGGETLTASSFRTASGGKGANQAVAAVRMSRPNPRKTQPSKAPEEVRVSMVGAVGNDEFGPQSIAGLENNGIDVSGIKRVNGQSTGIANVIVESKTGENRILLHPGANHSLKPEDFLTVESLMGSTLLAKPDLLILQLEIPQETVLQIIDMAGKNEIDVLLNPAPAVILPTQIYRYVTHLILNESEAALMTGSDLDVQHIFELNQAESALQMVANSFLHSGVQNVVITLGSKGAYFSTKPDKGTLIPAVKVSQLLDTTAAGDTFVGAYAVEMARQKRDGRPDIKKAVEWGCKAAARTVEIQGAQDAIPWIDEVEIT
ncbi:hypothetical protein MMC09_006133 [Bachmanniomyces sp. S44760]|nr:hypothetical protein [Bachmanniomyces sp. S44760]